MPRRNDAHIIDQISEARTDLNQTVQTQTAGLSREVSEVGSDTERQRRELAALISASVADLRSALESLRGDFNAVAQEIQQMRAESVPEQAAEIPGVAEQGEQQGHDINTLLALAAGIAYAEVVCHRDTWAFLVENASRSEHFRLPGDIEEDEDGTVTVDLSGRSLIAVIDALWNVREGERASLGTRHLAALLYKRIGDALTGLAGEGEASTDGPAGSTGGWTSGDQSRDVIRIVVDDRKHGSADHSEGETSQA